MKKQIFIYIFSLFISYGLSAQIFCPQDITVSCLSDLTPDECGMATVVSGNYHPSMIKYIDQDETNACNEGIVYRKFYIDVDYSNTYTENEPSCTQTITLIYTNLPLNIQYPLDKEYTCLDDIPVEYPTWLLNPCDLVGYTYEDEIFEFEAGACLKIVRTFTVINWCVYDVSTLEGLYTGIQLIKIVDNVPPEIDDCEDKYFDATENCEAMVTLTNSASEVGDCPSGFLTWRVSVDLWGDGTEDLFYGPNEPDPFRLDPVANGDQVNIEIPEALSVSKHKVVWKVTDGCGNVRSCSNEFFVEDNKPPTPYCLRFTTASLNGADDAEIIIPASLFNVDAVDNCSSKEEITFSFSENIEDTEKVVACGDTGFQFFRIYYTDKAGNQDFCEVFMLIFDNGTCFGKYAPGGFVSKPNGLPIEGVTAYLMENEALISLNESDETGVFTFGEQDLMEHYNAVVKKETSSMEDIDIEDFVLMRSALLGLEGLNFYQKVAADVNRDNSFNIDDLYEFRDVLLGRNEIAKEDAWKFIPKMYNLSDSQTNLNVSSSIPYTSYENGFDYYGVQTGDITGAIFSVDNISQTNEDIELTLIISKEYISILSNENFETDAYQFDFAQSDFQAMNESENSSILDIKDGMRYMNLNSSTKIVRNQELFKANVAVIDFENIEEIVNSAKIIRSGSLKSATIKWSIIDNRNDDPGLNESASIKVYPLPMQNRLTVEASNISNLALYTLTGERIDIETSILTERTEIKTPNSLPRGIYFLKITSNGVDEIVKVVK